MTPERLAQIETYFNGFRQKSDRCYSPKCQPFGLELVARVRELEADNARLLADIDKYEHPYSERNLNFASERFTAARLCEAVQEVARLRALIAEQDDEDCLCLACGAARIGGTCVRAALAGNCPWGQAAAAHRARMGEVRDDG